MCKDAQPYRAHSLGRERVPVCVREGASGNHDVRARERECVRACVHM